MAAKVSVARWANTPNTAELGAILGAGPRYLTVGHSGLDARGIGAMTELAGSRRGVFLHDTIPLDWPETQNDGAEARFRDRLAWVARAASHVFAPLASTADDISRHLGAHGWNGGIVVAPPGVDVAAPTAVQDGLQTERPYFVVVGTIEPRKNHAFLLDLWDSLPAPKPRLFVVGRRGWRSEDVFARLDRAAQTGDVIECNGLDDGAVSALLKGARALLFPSLAEGYGYPPLEAAALGVPVIAAPLPQTRAVLGDRVIYAPTDDLYQWQRAIGDMSTTGRSKGESPHLPKWFVHFDLVLKSLG
ncbi:MAG: glycosyltransferase family 1 protein [Pseudomonadota bacterium]